MNTAKRVNMYPVNDGQTTVSDISENYATGFVSLYRSIRHHWIWQDAEKLKWWLDILLEVNHSPKKVLMGGVLIECKKGQSLNSLMTWAKQWRTNVSAVRRFFKLLESDGMIVTENVSKTTRLTVCKYDSYQGMRHDDETMMKRRRNGSETQATTNNNDNNDNKNIEDLFESFWNQYNFKVGRKKAFSAFKNLSQKDRDAAIAGIEAYQVTVTDPKYKQHPTTYLNARTWEDDRKVDTTINVFEKPKEQDLDTFFDRPKVKLPWDDEL